MNSTKNKVQDSKILKEVYEYAKELQEYGAIGGLISIGIFFITKTFYIVNTSTVNQWVYTHPDFMKYTLVVSIVYTCIMLLLICIKYILSVYASNYNVVVYCRSVASFMLFPFELSIYGVKSIIVITFSFVPEYRNMFEGGTYYLIFILVYLDFAVSILICYMKSTVLRPLIPNGGFFSKIDGNFEYFFILLIPLKHLFFYLTAWNDIVTQESVIKKEPEWLFVVVELCLMVVISTIYLKELPYYNPMSERVLAHFLLSTSLIYMLVNVFTNDLNKLTKIYLIVLPIEIISFEYFLRYVYRIDYMDPKQTKNHKCLKKIMMISWQNSSQHFEMIYSQGVFMNYIKNKKHINSEDMAMWRNVQKLNYEDAEDGGNGDRDDSNLLDEDLKKDGKLNPAKTKVFERQQSMTPLSNEMNQDDIDQIDGLSNSDGSVEQEEFQAQKNRTDANQIKNQLENIIVNSYVDSNKKLPYAHLIRIYWMLKNRAILFSVFQDLRDLLELSNSLKSKFIYYYALKEVEVFLQNFYSNPEMVSQTTGIEISSSATTAKAHKSSSTTTLDLAYALYHKYTVQYMKTTIEAYSERNLKFIDELMMANNGYKQLHDHVTTLKKLDNKITTVFENYHRDSKNTETEHILPYSVHVCYNTNFLRSGKNLLAEYIKRTQIKTRIQEEMNPNIVPDQILLDTVVLLTESDKHSIGTIVDVYGDTLKLLNIRSKTLLGKNPNYLIPNCMALYHNKIMQNYMKTPLRYFFGITRDSFIKIPESRFIISAHIVLKIVPNMESNFKIVVAIKPTQRKYNQKMIISPNFTVDSYSFNFLNIFKDEYLAPGLPVQDLSPDLFNYIQDTIKEIDKNKEDLPTIQLKKDIVKEFNDISQKEMERLENHGNQHDERSAVSFSVQSKVKSTEVNNSIATNIFELTFTSTETGNQVKKYYKIKIEVKEFIAVNKRMYYLDMAGVEENEQKSYILQIEENKKRLERPGSLKDYTEFQEIEKSEVDIKKESSVPLQKKKSLANNLFNTDKLNVISAKKNTLDSLERSNVDYGDELEEFGSKLSISKLAGVEKSSNPSLTGKSGNLSSLGGTRTYKFMKGHPTTQECRIAEKLTRAESPPNRNTLGVPKEETTILINRLGILKGIVRKDQLSQLAIPKHITSMRRESGSDIREPSIQTSNLGQSSNVFNSLKNHDLSSAEDQKQERERAPSSNHG